MYKTDVWQDNSIHIIMFLMMVWTYRAITLHIVAAVFLDPKTIAPSWKYIMMGGRLAVSKGLMTSTGIPPVKI